jgi:tRNA threonylcarbamoyladenosine biosynthesis protein TsaE
VKTWSFDSQGPESTHDLARALGRSIGPDGVVIGLIGPLGAGKTVFVKGLAEGLGVESESVSSPTFVIAQQYPVPAATPPRPDVLHHVDLYRLESEDELEAMGFADLFEPGGVVAVEWCDRFPGVLGPERLEIELEGPSVAEATKRGRSARMRAHGPIAEAALEDWVEAVEQGSRASTKSAGVGLGPQQRVIGVLALALAIGGFARFEPARSVAPVCERPHSILEDSLGTLRVECGVERSVAFGAAGPPDRRLAPPTGVGAWLFGGRVPIDVVTAGQLEALPGIGPTRAQAIVDARAQARFERVAELERVSGIGPKTVDVLSRWLSDAQCIDANGETTTDEAAECHRGAAHG